jgi:hypothetical protein
MYLDSYVVAMVSKPQSMRFTTSSMMKVLEMTSMMKLKYLKVNLKILNQIFLKLFDKERKG